MADPEIGKLSSRGTFFTDLAMEMAAVAANDATHRCGRRLIFLPYRRRRIWLDQSKGFVLSWHMDPLWQLLSSSRRAPSPPPSRNRYFGNNDANVKKY